MSYVDTYILEANRVQSQQYNDEEDTSIWTNTVSDGLKLNVGDKISLSSAFISDLGAEDSTIEFKGEVIQNEQKFIVSKIQDFKPDTDAFAIRLKTAPRPNLVTQLISASEVTINNIRDNEANIVISYYKTNNGEYMINLPFYAHPAQTETTPDKTAWTQIRQNHQYANILNSSVPREASHMPLKCNASHLFGEDYVIDPENKYGGLIIDNSRYMIFAQTETQVNYDTDSTTDENNIPFRDINGYRNYYSRYRELLKLKVPIGFNSPSEISNVISEQLSEQTKLKNKTIDFYSASTTSVLKTPVGSYNETKTNKLFNCQNFTGTKLSTAEKYYGNGTTTATKPTHYGQEIRDYNSGYQYMGIKRPELYEAGVELKMSVNNQAEGGGSVQLDTSINIPLLNIATDTGVNNWLRLPRGSLQNQIGLFPQESETPPTTRFPNWIADTTPVDDAFMRDNLNPYFTDFLSENPFRKWNEQATDELTTPYTVINTGMEWNQENLNKLKDFFENQSRYPELFDMNHTNNQLAYRKNVTNYKQIYNGEDITVDTHRFLHLQSVDNDLMPKELGVHTDPNGSATRILSVVDDPTLIGDTGVYTSFGYDNIPSTFSSGGTANGTVNTKDKDFSSMPLFVKYFEEYKNNGSGQTKEQFDQTLWNDGSNVPYRPASASDVKGDNLWGGFAIRSKSSCCVVPVKGLNPTFPEFREYQYVTTADEMEVVKSYNPEQEVFNFVTDAGYADKFGSGSATYQYQKSVYDTISFIAQVPWSYLENQDIFTQIDASGDYQPTAVPVSRSIPTLYKIDYYGSWLSQTVGTRELPIQRLMPVTTRRIGYDNHPTAYGNAYIGLYNGLAGAGGMSYNGEYINAINQQPRLDIRDATAIIHNSVSLDADKYLNEVYCGALNPLFSFDTVTSRFSISGLHTSEKITAKWNATWQVAGGDPSASKQSAITSVPVPDNLGNPIYKVNKIFDFRNYCPSISPYFNTVPETIDGTSEEFPVVYNNPYCKTGTIFDMTSGIFLEDFKIEKDNFKNSFWGICGFTYNDLNIESTGNINVRVTTGQYDNTRHLTTNQNVINTDIGQLDGVATGVANYKNQYSYPIVLNYKKEAQTTQIETFAPVEVESESSKIEATNLPAKTLRPYFTIRTDLLTDSYFNGGQNEPSLMPVVAVVEKSSQYGDFFYGQGQIEFTNTFPRTITQVTTQICDPSGKPSKLSPDSSILYKITKNNTAKLNILQDVLQANKNNPNIQQEILG